MRLYKYLPNFWVTRHKESKIWFLFSNTWFIKDNHNWYGHTSLIKFREILDKIIVI